MEKNIYLETTIILFFLYTPFISKQIIKLFVLNMFRYVYTGSIHINSRPERNGKHINFWRNTYPVKSSHRYGNGCITGSCRKGYYSSLFVFFKKANRIDIGHKQKNQSIKNNHCSYSNNDFN